MRSILRLVAVVALAALAAAACSGTSATTTTGAPGTTSGSSGLTGSIEVSGSSTVEPITARVGQAFSAANPSVGVSVEGPGTGDGFARFCNGETDISDASRPIKDKERDTCAENGVEFVELHIATDGIAVLTSHDNDSVSCLDFKDMYALVGPESEGFELWSDANDLGTELGAGHVPYPDAPLVITAPGEESGTYDTFVELVIEDIAKERGQEVATRADYEASANDNVIVNGIAGNPTSFGWVGYAFYAENTDVLKAIEVDGGDGCVFPTEETIASFEYPLARPLFIYVNMEKAKSNPTLEAFVDYYLSDEGLQAVTDAGYVALPADDIAGTRAAWEAVK